MGEFRVFFRVILFTTLWVIICKILGLNNSNLFLSSLIVALMSVSSQFTQYLRFPITLGALWSIGVIAVDIPQPKKIFDLLSSKDASILSSVVTNTQFTTPKKRSSPSHLKTRLEQLNEAKKAGLISESEYKSMRSDLIGSFVAKK